jgi:hypothetical protein
MLPFVIKQGTGNRGGGLQSGRSRVRFPMVSLKFFNDIILLVALWPRGRLSLQQKWVSIRCIFWAKGGQCIRLTTSPPSCAIVMKSGNLNFLEPSRSLQACNRTALPLPLQEVVDFWMFEFPTTHAFLHYKFSRIIRNSAFECQIQTFVQAWWTNILSSGAICQ